MKEINFNDPKCTDSLASGLTFYSSKCNPDQSRQWALEWIEVNLPEEYDRLKQAKSAQFSNRGFICRMIQNGLQVDDSQIQKMIQFFKDISIEPKIEVIEEQPVRPKKSVQTFNQIIYQMEDVIDQILSDQEIDPITIPADSKQLKEAVVWLEKEMIEASEQINKQKAILAQLEQVLNRCDGIKEKLEKPKIKKSPVLTHSDKVKASNKMVIKKTYPELGLTSLNPAKLVGAKVALLYHTEHRTVNYYVALPGQTLSVSGKSIKGFDETKSYAKTLRKPEVFFAEAGKKMTALETLTSKPRGVRSQIPDTMMILEVI